ncbi:MAG: response regulator transcription factor [Magnetovibrio sp.]|nr:response regulator transcription factor [Magnetovibrio sp.]
MLAHALDYAGLEAVGTAGDGAAGIDLFKSAAPDLTLLDIRMPGMDGREVLAEIRAANPDAYVLMVSVSKDLESISQSMYRGAQDFIRKDRPMERIVKRLQGHAERFRAGDLSTIAERVAGNLSDTED